MPRLTQRSLTFGPIIVSVRYMLKDVVTWIFLLLWLLFTFASFFRALHLENYGSPTDAPSDCINPDLDFEDFLSTVRILFQLSLEGSGAYDCFLAASTRNFSVPVMYHKGAIGHRPYPHATLLPPDATLTTVCFGD